MNQEQRPTGPKRKRKERLFIPPPAVGLKGRPSTESTRSSVLKEYASPDEEIPSKTGQETGEPAAEKSPKETLTEDWGAREETWQGDEGEGRRLKNVEARLDRLEHRISDFENTCYSFLLHAKRLSDRAVSFYEDVFGLSKEDLAYIHDRLGINYNNNGEYEKAIESFSKTVEFDEKNALANFKLGVAFDNAGNHREAIESYRKTISLDSSYLKAYYKLADIYTKNGNHDEAVRCLTKAIELAPEIAESHYRLGTVHIQNKNYNEAVASYLRVVERAPTFQGIYRSLGLAYESKGEHDKAIEFFKKSD